MTKVNFTTETKQNCNPSINPSSQEKTEIPSVLDLSDHINKTTHQVSALLNAYILLFGEGEHTSPLRNDIVANGLWAIENLIDRLDVYADQWLEQWRETRNSMITA